MYVYDTMYISGKDVNNLICAVNNELVIINNWFISNCLTLNLNKLSFIIFHSSKKNLYHFTLLFLLTIVFQTGLIKFGVLMAFWCMNI